ncbi:MAG TPA: ABC transporter ATP-binding protein [Opitutaceae bacterium]|nr:ABC transporter ATP-binding protein [Opitutaceae bacterium]
MNAIELTGLVKEFAGGPPGGRRRALDGVTLRVREGEIVGLLGPNGSGKSTLLKLLLGLLRPTAGRSLLWGAPPEDAAARAAVGYLPEAPGFPPDLTGDEFVRLQARLSGLPHAGLTERVEQTLARVGLAAAGHQRAGRYSLGMRRRLGLAQAIVHDPRMLLLDEPVSGLDPAGVAALAALLGECRARGRTVLFSSHVLEPMVEFCDRLVVLQDGRVVLDAAVADLARRAGRVALLVDPLPPGLVDELRQWLAARGARLHGVEASAAALARIVRETVHAGAVAGAAEP